MRNYPIDSNVKGMIATESAIGLINAAFYDGFMTAILETPEELDSLTVEDRIRLMTIAKEKNTSLTRNKLGSVKKNEQTRGYKNTYETVF